MKRIVKKYSKDDDRQEMDNLRFWQSKSPQYKLHILEEMRQEWYQIQKDGDKQHEAPKRLQRILTVTKRT